MAYDRGSPILIEVEFKRRTPFGTLDYFDPTTPKITVTDQYGTVRVNAADLTKSATGKWYYICQTGATWSVGPYRSTVTGTDGTYTETDIEPELFELE